MKIYLASRYSRHPEMREVRDRLHALGHEVTSRWIDMHGGKQESSATPEALNGDPGSVARFAYADIEDVGSADLVVSFTGAGGKGGRHVEFGFGLALGKTMVIVGPREHVFHALPEVIQYEAVEDMLEDLPEVQQLVEDSFGRGA